MNMQRKRSEADWAVEILRQRQQPVFYGELVEEIADKMARKNDPASLMSIYTRLNLDSRLVHQGEGFWYYDETRIHRKEF